MSRIFTGDMRTWKETIELAAESEKKLCNGNTVFELIRL